MGLLPGGSIIGLMMIALGLLSIFARNLFWRWEKFGDAIRGKRSERTAVWDMWQILKGVLIIAFGLALLSGSW